MTRQQLQAFELWVESVKAATPITVDENPQRKAARLARAKKDYDFFVEHYFPHYCQDPITGAHIASADFHIKFANHVLNHRSTVAVAEWPREHAKSVHCNIFIPIWLMLHGDLDGMVLVGKSGDAAKRLLGDIQAELEGNQRLIADLGIQKGLGNWADGEFKTKEGIAFIALGRGQSPRGIRERQRRPNYCVVDDIDDDEIVLNQHRVGKVVDWLLGALYGALDIKKSRLVFAGNRIHRKSILAHIVGDHENPKVKRKGVYHSKVYAIERNRPAWPAKYTLEQLKAKMDVMGYAISQREYFHNPIIEGKVFKNEWIRWEKMPKLSEFTRIICYTDPSFKATATSDFKAVKLWGLKGTYFYLIDCFVRQTSVTAMVQWTYDLYERLGPNVPVQYMVEANFIQDQLLDDYYAEGNKRGYQLPITGDFRQKPDKISRIISMQPYYERGWVIYNKEQQDKIDFKTAVEHLTAIEQGANTAFDSPDADEGAWYYLRSQIAIQSNNRRIGRRPQRPF
jgi:phage terminase large subunit-like protein